MVHWVCMHTKPGVNRPRLSGDRWPRRSQWNVLQLPRAFVLALLILVVLSPQAVLAQAGSQQSAEQPASPDTAQTKINQTPAATPAQGPATVVLTPIRDEQGVMAVAVPAAWNQVAQGEWRIAGAPAGRILSASPNQGNFATNWGTPGIALYYSTSLPAAMEPEDLLGVFDYAGTCQDGGRGTLGSGPRSVTYQIWQNCGGTGTAAAVLVLTPAGREYYAVVEVYLASVDDLRALGPILRSVQFGPQATAVGNAGGGEPAAAPAATLPPPTPLPEVAPTPAPATVLATVSTDRLNLRSGPSTTVPRLTVVTRGMQLTVTGQTGNCAWLRVTAPDGQQGWVSGDPQFVTLGAQCETIPAVSQ